MAICTSQKKGTAKKAVDQANILENHGIEGDAHAGNWHRQISMLAEESVDTMRAACALPLTAGAFAENINTEGIDLKVLPVGTRLRVGEAEVEVTQIGKRCHNDGCAIQRAAGHCVMPTEGIFVVVVREGVVRKGDPIEVLTSAAEMGDGNGSD